MPERIRATSAPTSHLTQADEALRQVQAGRTAQTLIGLRRVAAILSEQPDEPMTDDLRIQATDRHVRSLRCVYRDARTAGIVLWGIVDALPPVLPGDSRGEYSTRILLKVAEVTV
ncbi:hypothetical protein [Streptosporangium amethystogenes]|uniref:hypothetical protein n=1 Tax=Streptosporangium amethystogenes TaxID=2002 RepID=UPI0004BD90AB|nr:hypothetical protein [Streptosporangium amethystogenes]KUJ65414.1 hypothetical protein ACZ90_47925 [Streptomyces albus subsp. albus]